jgi:CBS-domain-containing membrane protein
MFNNSYDKQYDTELTEATTTNQRPSLRLEQIYDSDVKKFWEEYDEVIDVDDNETQCLKRYQAMFRSLRRKGYQTLPRPLTEADISKNIKDTIVDLSVTYALKGESFMNEIQSDIQYVVLQVSCCPRYIVFF